METKKFKQASLRRGLLLLLTFAVVTLISSQNVYAYDCSNPDDLALTCFEGVFANVLKGVLALVGILFFLFLIKGGVAYTMSGGDAKAVDAARKTITTALIGLGLAVIAFAIMKLLGDTFNTNLLRFVIPPPA